MSSGRNGHVENEKKREELIGILEELSDRKIQIDLWINHKDYPNFSGIDQVYHFLFDDTDLGCNAENEIGFIIKNKEEAFLIDELCILLSEINGRLGDRDSLSYINDDKWKNIIKFSNKILNKMRDLDLSHDDY